MKNSKFFIALLVLCVVESKLHSQSKTDIALYNIGLGSFVGGLGAIINKKPNEKTGKVLLKGLLQGGGGGYLVYQSKNLLLKIPENNKLEYSWGAKFVNSLGISIIENASLNNDFWNKWHINIGFNRLEIETKEKIKFKYRIMPVALILTGIFAYDHKFELEKTLRTGEIIFSVSKKFEHAGAVWGKLILLEKNHLDDFHTISHEIVHSFQYEDFNFVNTFLNKPRTKLLGKSKLGNKLDKIFYFDLQAPVLELYLLENGGDEYYDNFFEYEAGLFSNTLLKN
ncbi:hypothetical protein JCM19301_2438 [Jejuia pallidilutea]|uniref:Uncharacterized protein n=1 Tax=Jejuia pallidilutea TaxID=504487 RepID=A0A090VQP8_9FLAO|nr:hypothetical protein [Jejuia pallidilutea]GAL66343.1 hypothetical protein JCM19301_2438 [Jejuia pallidilutea]